MTTHRIARPDPLAQRVSHRCPNAGTPLWASLHGTGPTRTVRHQSRSVHAQLGPWPPTRASTTDGNPGTRISFDRNSRTVAESCKPPPGPACRSSDASVSTALMTAVEPQQPGYLPHSDAAAAPVDRLPHRQTLIVSHRPQRLPSPPLSVPDQSIAFTERGQHGDRQTLEPAFPVGPFFAQYRLGI